MSKDFNKDNQKGKEGEKQIINLIKNKYKSATIEQAPNEKFTDYDIKVIYKNNEETTLEVKNDDRAKDTNNLFIETEMQNAYQQFELSGLSVTKADWWVHIVGDRIFLFRTKELKEFLQDYELREITVDSGKKGKCYLVPMEEMQKINRSKL